MALRWTIAPAVATYLTCATGDVPPWVVARRYLCLASTRLRGCRLHVWMFAHGATATPSSVPEFVCVFVVCMRESQWQSLEFAECSCDIDPFWIKPSLFGFPPAHPGGPRLPGTGAVRFYRARSRLPLAAARVLFTVARGLLSSIVVACHVSLWSRVIFTLTGNGHR